MKSLGPDKKILLISLYGAVHLHSLQTLHSIVSIEATIFSILVSSFSGFHFDKKVSTP